MKASQSNLVGENRINENYLSFNNKMPWLEAREFFISLDENRVIAIDFIGYPMWLYLSDIENLEVYWPHKGNYWPEPKRDSFLNIDLLDEIEFKEIKAETVYVVSGEKAEVMYYSLIEYAKRENINVKFLLRIYEYELGIESEEELQYRIENVEEAFTTETLTILKVNISWKEES
tara:strand:- start:356 stop:880 length:525 start_codon:yes stop_codon:yes gene_type:complete